MFPLCHKAVQQYFFFFLLNLSWNATKSMAGSHKSLLIILNFIFVIKSANSGAAAESQRTAINLSSKNNTEVCSCLTYAAFI